MDTSNILIYRIIHINNLEYILKIGKITNHNSKNADPVYTGIGERDLIKLRTDDEIYVQGNEKPFCPSCDYIPFYFASRSVMLYTIQKGFNSVKKVNPENIIYFVSRLDNILEKYQYLYTDGHGYAKFTQWFDDIKYINKIDWNTVKSKYWNNTEDDTDRKRRKQAEFWIKGDINLNDISGIAVYNETALKKVEELCKKHNYNIAFKIKKNYYY